MKPADLFDCTPEIIGPTPGSPCGLKHRLYSSFLLAYQPIVQARAPHRTIWREALARVLDPGGIERSPEYLSESPGLEVEIDRMALLQAYEDLQCDPTLRVSLNVGKASLLDRSWQAGLDLLCASRDIATRVMLEITERQRFRSDYADALALEPFRRAGITLALDDLGSGDTTIRDIDRIAPDIVKIPPSVWMSTDPSRSHLFHQIVEAARGVNARIVAEGIEHPSMIQSFSLRGAHYLQGYAFGRPAFLHFDS